ncbi:hypothetical protein HJC23_010896 [Cyclotella cryptica]|uniref:Uncharacterized protein n=1 Tax=Cyclotella cryptica TaxID=29204 RepID=A0ABD3Q8G3_9STRA|eukprot:CCRYP_007524-RA/>CCRYP_007524-RA protein AED:0.01 eAED:0.01 QI:0/-1/0/1/-1/1/1/0/665
MEIHRRSRQSTNDVKQSDSHLTNSRHKNGSSSHSYRGVPSSASSTDAVLVRSTQLIIVMGMCWFLYLIASVNDVTSSSSAGSNGNVRGSSLLRHGGEPLQPESLHSKQGLNSKYTNQSSTSFSSTREQIESIRSEFYTRYGGKEEALAMLKRGLKTFAKKSWEETSHADSVFRTDSLKGTAMRLLKVKLHHEQQSSQDLPKFILSFGGYSVTVGRGNHFSQSFPFIFSSILKPLLQSLGLDLIVRNSAIGGIPSFPYGWCLPNFLGSDSHGISWDYGMNEGNGGMGLESYLRHGLAGMQNSPPLFVMVDTKQVRLGVLQHYVDEGYLLDPIALGGKEAVKKEFLKMPESTRPKGFQKWDEWGAPQGAPGQSPWHPKKMEHELMGWMLAMYFVESVEAALAIMDNDDDWRERVLHDGLYETAKGRLPPPITDATGTGVPSLLHGVPSHEDGRSEWHMNKVSCRTSFLPNISGRLESIVVSGMTIDDEDMIKPRDDSLFNGGWVMDVGKVERETKEKVNKYGGLGYIDMKTALYGIPSSGTLKLWLPYESTSKHEDMKNGAPASEYYESIVFCEVNEKRGDNECNMSSDLAFSVGGSTVAKGDVTQIAGIASYLKKDICIRVGVPVSAKISSKEQNFGLTVEVAVTNSAVSRQNGACSISHVIWEHQ